MKRLPAILTLIIAVFATFIIAGNVNAASVEFGSGLKGQYNLGDSVSIDGKVSSNAAKSGLFKLQLYCNNGATGVVKSKFLNLDGSNAYVFAEQIILPAGVDGNCHVEGIFDDAKSNSNGFTITKELVGSFEISKNSLQLGEGFSFYGNVYKLNNNPIDGAATISLINSGQVYDVNSVEIKNGGFNYSYQARNIPAGKYNIDVEVMDAFGNGKKFANVKGFDVYNELKINAKVDKLEILPGDSIVVDGEVKYRNNELVKDAKLLINNNNVALDGGKFSFTINTAGNIKSWQNDVAIKANDEYGNFGEGLMSFRVIAVASKLVVNKNKQEYYPRDALEVNSYLYDQAGESMENDAIVSLKNPDGGEVEKGVGNLIYRFDDAAVPGTWRIIASQDKLNVEENVEVKELANLSITLAGQDILIRNIGNIDYDGVIVARFDNQIFNQPMKLGLNETYIIETDRFHGERNVSVFALGREFYLGKLNIEDERGFFGKLGDRLTGNVVNADEEKASNPWIYVGILIVLIGIISGFYIYKRRNDMRYETLRSMEKKEAARYAEMVRKSKEKATGKKKYSFGGKPMKEEDVKDFREQMLGRVQEEERKRSRSPYETRHKDDSERPRMLG